MYKRQGKGSCGAGHCVWRLRGGIREGILLSLIHILKDAISLGVGEPDFETPWHIREEGIYSLEKGRTFYTSNAGLKPLKVEICEYLKRRCGVTYDPDQEILVTVGGSEAIDIALRAICLLYTSTGKEQEGR